ncbi:hypothetical protein J6590_097467 [Homalodisca vitripennis]|nr:hypothetical protein J6590_095050 [Homalodisca vitripennis]KAG8260426.1 hypothetical protein J6590_097467 [Homalodisca vitripennis]
MEQAQLERREPLNGSAWLSSHLQNQLLYIQFYWYSNTFLPESDFQPPPMAGRAGWLLARTGSLSGHPSKQQPRSTLLDSVTLR